jgi:glycine/D-amino acid oxidase-like deaminating enzyme
MQAKSFDALIVGGGIVGAACARELACAGLHVAICEMGDHLGGGATAAGMGHLAVMDDSDAQFALTSYSQTLWRQLSNELPKTAEYLNCGSLWVAADEEEFREVERKRRFYSEHQIPVEVLDSKQLAEAEPHLRAGLAGALRMSADSVCYPPSAAQYLAQQAAAAGAQVLFNKHVIEISDAGVKMLDGASLAPGLVIAATGAATSKLLPAVEVHPRKGHLLITDRYPSVLRHQLIELGYLKSAHATTTDSVAFNAQPRITGQILIGSSRQYGVEDPSVEQNILARMLKRAIDYMPALENLSGIRAWTGFRAATPDKLPLIGRLPGFERVYLATGHEGLGISTSLATARLLADQILKRPSAISPSPYDPGRSFPAHA